MKASPIIRAAAVVTTSVALVAGGSSLASADESGATSSSSITADKSRPAQSAPTAEGARKAPSNARAAAVPNITRVRLQNYVVSSKGKKYLGGHARISNASNFRMGYARVYRGKKRVGTARIYSSGNVYFTYQPKRDGRGRFRVGATKVYRYNGGSYWDRTKGYSHIRAGLKGGLKIKARGSRHVFRSHAKYFSTSKGKWKGYKHRAYLQHKKGGKWRTFKKIKLNKKGKDKYVKYTSKNRKYRLKLKKTSKVVGGRTSPSRKI